MRAGRLKDVATLNGADGSQLGAVHLVGIEDKDDSIAFDEGLRSTAKITIRSRWHQDISMGNYWLSDGRIFLINGASNPDGAKRDALCSCTELVGAPVLIDPLGVNIGAKCALTNYKAKMIDGHNPYQGNEERRQAEFANIQYKPVIGHEFNLAGALYRITEQDEKESDSIVTRCWVEFISYEDV